MLYMKQFLFSAVLFLGLLLTACSSSKSGIPDVAAPLENIKTDTLVLFDRGRDRSIPVAYYYNRKSKPTKGVIFFSHGYGANKGGDYLAYSYLTTFLASHGYFVVSLQHELPSDELLPMTGDLQQVRKPNWQRGSDNLLFVLKSLKFSRPEMNYNQLTLIGHSNGGDMTMLFAAQHPEDIVKAISLDNRRMLLPRVSSPKIYSLRSADLPADQWVIPTKAEQEKYGITVITLPKTNHSDMDDKGTAAQKEEIQNYILGFLKE